jgi:hypothetical protein
MGIDLDRDLRRIQFVLAVARDLHFGKAAARLNIAQSYLSRAVKEFENERGYLSLSGTENALRPLRIPGRHSFAQSSRCSMISEPDSSEPAKWAY